MKLKPDDPVPFVTDNHATISQMHELNVRGSIKLLTVPMQFGSMRLYWCWIRFKDACRIKEAAGISGDKEAGVNWLFRWDV